MVNDRTMEHDDLPPSTTAGGAHDTPASRARVEDGVRVALQVGDLPSAADEVLLAHGPELFGFVVGALNDREAALGVYDCVRERLVRELPTFGWRCALRTWAYAVAWHELALFAERPNPPQTRSAPPSVTIADPTTTISRRATGMRDAIATMRRELAQEDRAILILHIDRGFRWGELAIVALGERASRLEIEGEAWRLRNRFGALREELARAAVKHQILEPR